MFLSSILQKFRGIKVYGCGDSCTGSLHAGGSCVGEIFRFIYMYTIKTWLVYCLFWEGISGHWLSFLGLFVELKACVVME